MRVNAEKWCVYYHKHNGFIFYVGVGQVDRAFEILGRSGKWYLFLEGIEQEYDVEIARWFDTREEAFEHEQSEIGRLLPVCNRESWYPNNQEDTKRKWIHLMKLSDDDISPFLQPK